MTDNSNALVLEYIDGIPLYRCIWQYKERGTLPEHVAKFFAAQIVLALEEIHFKGIIHGDLKTGNVLVQRNGQLKVIDFGLASILSDNTGRESECGVRLHSPRDQSIRGTHYIMAPEVFRGRQHGIEADWWSFGVILYEMVCGRPPWPYRKEDGSSGDEYFQRILAFSQEFVHTEHPSFQVEHNLSHSLVSLLRNLLVIDPSKRLGFNGAQEVSGECGVSRNSMSYPHGNLKS